MSIGNLYIESSGGELRKIERKKKGSDIYVMGGGIINLPVRTKYEMYLKTPEFSVGNYYKYYYLLVKHLLPKSTILGRATRTKPKILRYKDILSILNTSNKTCNSFLKECFERQYLLDLNQGGYSVNPLYFRNGVKIGYTDFMIWVNVSKEYRDSLGDDLKYVMNILDEYGVADYSIIERFMKDK